MRIYARIIILSLSLSVVPLVLVAGIFFYNSQKGLKGEIYQRLNAISILKKNKVETFFASRREDLRAIQGFLDVQINLPTLQEFDRDRYSLAYSKAKWQLEDQLRAFMNSYAYADILLLSTKGKVVFAANPGHVKLYLDRILFNNTVLEKAKNGIYYSGPVATKDWKYPYILYMASQAYDTSGQFAGYIVLVVDMGVIYNIISDNTGLGNTGETFLIKKNPTGRYVFISPLLYDYGAIFNKEMAWVDEVSLDGKRIKETVDYQGNQVLEVWQQLDEPDWRMITKINRLEAFASISNMRTMFFIVCLLILTMILMGCVLFAESIFDPIQKLQAMAVHDPLTGVLNRRGLQEVLTKTFAVSQRTGISVQVLLLDLDDFKQINDRFGHGMGDAILVDVTQQIKQTIRQTDYIARVGGDEFMVLLFDAKQADAIMVADKIREAIAGISHNAYSGDIVRVTCSMGIVPLEVKPISIDALLQKLHFSLHLSKNQGKNRANYQTS